MYTAWNIDAILNHRPWTSAPEYNQEMATLAMAGFTFPSGIVCLDRSFIIGRYRDFLLRWMHHFEKPIEVAIWTIRAFWLSNLFSWQNEVMNDMY